MAQLQQQFNANAIDPTQGGNFKPLMLGKYPCVIKASEVKANKDPQTGGQVVFEIVAIDGPMIGQSGQWILNLYHNDEQTRNIAEKSLSAVCHATGQFLINDTAALHDKPFAIDVSEQALTSKQQQDKEAGKNVTPFRNVRVLMADGSEVSHGAAQAPSQQQQQAPAPAAGAWGAPAASAPAPAAAGGWSQAGAPAAGSRPAWGAK